MWRKVLSFFNAKYKKSLKTLNNKILRRKKESEMSRDRGERRETVKERLYNEKQLVSIVYFCVWGVWKIDWEWQIVKLTFKLKSYHDLLQNL